MLRDWRNNPTNWRSETLFHTVLVTNNTAHKKSKINNVLILLKEFYFKNTGLKTSKTRSFIVHPNTIISCNVATGSISG